MKRFTITLTFFFLFAICNGCENETVQGLRFDEISVTEIGNESDKEEDKGNGSEDGNKADDDGNTSQDDSNGTSDDNTSYADISDAIVAQADVTELMQSKAEAYRTNSLSAGKTLNNGVYVYTTTVTAYASTPARLAARIALLGFRTVYLSPGKTKITSANSWLRTFIATCSGYGVKVYALRLSEAAMLAASDKTIAAEVELITTYNGKVAANERFAGISADIEPHTYKTDTAGAGYIWNSNTNYGIGKDNDMLLKKTIDRLSYAAGLLHAAGLELQEAVWYNYQIYYDAGELSYGSVEQFLDGGCNWVSDMVYRNKTASIWEKSEPMLRATTKASTVSTCLKTATNGEASSTLQYNGWDALLETVATIRDCSLAYDSFRGIDMFTFEGLETMWKWTGDKE